MRLILGINVLMSVMSIATMASAYMHNFVYAGLCGTVLAGLYMVGLGLTLRQEIKNEQDK